LWANGLESTVRTVPFLGRIPKMKFYNGNSACTIPENIAKKLYSLVNYYGREIATLLPDVEAEVL
jgi:hypothetical protein